MTKVVTKTALFIGLISVFFVSIVNNEVFHKPLFQSQHPSRVNEEWGSFSFLTSKLAKVTSL